MYFLLFFTFSKFPDLFRWFKDFLGYKESGVVDAIPQSATTKERVTGEFAMEIGESQVYNFIFTKFAILISLPLFAVLIIL